MTTAIIIALGAFWTVTMSRCVPEAMTYVAIVSLYVLGLNGFI